MVQNSTSQHNPMAHKELIIIIMGYCDISGKYNFHYVRKNILLPTTFFRSTKVNNSVRMILISFVMITVVLIILSTRRVSSKPKPPPYLFKNNLPKISGMLSTHISGA